MGRLHPGVEATTQVAAKISKDHFFENGSVKYWGPFATCRPEMCVKRDLYSRIEKGSQVHTWEPGRASLCFSVINKIKVREK